jgi:hypothetical protein
MYHCASFHWFFIGRAGRSTKVMEGFPTPSNQKAVFWFDNVFSAVFRQGCYFDLTATAFHTILV